MTAAARAVVVDADSRLATRHAEWLRQERFEIAVASSLRQARATVSDAPADILIIAVDPLASADAVAFALEQHRRRAAATIFTLAASDADVLAAVARVPCSTVLCHPIHQEQLAASAAVLARRREERSAVAYWAEDDRLRACRPRAREVVRLLLEHQRVPAIARALGISPHTVRNHLKTVFRTFGVHSQQELLARLNHHQPA